MNGERLFYRNLFYTVVFLADEQDAVNAEVVPEDRMCLLGVAIGTGAIGSKLQGGVAVAQVLVAVGEGEVLEQDDGVYLLASIFSTLILSLNKGKSKDKN